MSLDCQVSPEVVLFSRIKLKLRQIVSQALDETCQGFYSIDCQKTCLNVSVVKNLSIIRIIEAPLPYEIRSNISLISAGCFTGMDIGWELSKASIRKTSCWKKIIFNKHKRFLACKSWVTNCSRSFSSGWMASTPKYST